MDRVGARWLALVLAGAVGCGRFDYDELALSAGDAAGLDAGRRDDAGSRDAAASLDASLDASSPDDAASGADAGTGPDVDAGPPAMCGDAVCAGLAGETCLTCADCDTTSAVCGNLFCNGAEDGTSCATDCGPPVWSPDWVAEEDAYFSMVNALRTNPAGLDCPDAHYPPTMPLTHAADLRRIARMWAWSFGLSSDPALSCNGSDFIDPTTEHGVTIRQGFHVTRAGAPLSAAEAIAVGVANDSICAAIMSPMNTEVGYGYAEGGIKSVHYGYYR